MKRFLSSWQGLLAGVLGISLFLFSPKFIFMFDPSSGICDGGYLHRVFTAMATFLIGIFTVWIGWQISFPSMDRWADTHLNDAFKNMAGLHKILMVQGTFIFLFIIWILTLS